MTTIKKIFNKLHNADKLELATEKIELSLAKDIQSELKKLLTRIDFMFNTYLRENVFKV